MSTYHDHADAAGLERRLRIMASHSDRATMLRILEERDIGCVTLTMRKDELRARLTEALVVCGRLVIGAPRTWRSAPCNLQNMPREG